MLARGAAWIRPGTLGACWASACVALACAGPAPPGAGGAPPRDRAAGEGGIGLRARGTGGYEIELRGDRWRQLSDSEGQAEADLHFVRENGSAWLMVFPASGATLRLDAIAVSRRGAILAAGATHYREERFFLGGSPDRVASLARYAGGGEVILVLTVVRGPFGVELVSGTRLGSGLEPELREILYSLELPELGDPGVEGSR